MEIRNCPQCGQLYTYSGHRLCPSCYQKEAEVFELVEQYLHDHPGANLEAVAQGTGIAKEVILDFIRRGRLVTLSTEGLLRCEICGRGIDHGRICDDCAVKLRGGKLSPAGPGIKDRSKGVLVRSDNKMHIADLLEKRGRLRR
ncbi:MAG TPA: hypothetical protein VJ036_02965 [bacterium]|jgi:ribosomal protein L32|nr:hypothetical protein [bacterium]